MQGSLDENLMQQQKRPEQPGRFTFWELSSARLARDSQRLVCKYRSEPPRLVLIVQQDNGNYAKIAFARVALRDFAL